MPSHPVYSTIETVDLSIFARFGKGSQMRIYDIAAMLPPGVQREQYNGLVSDIESGTAQ